MLLLLRDNPTLMPPVLGDADAALQIEHRRLDEIHDCLHCGRRAERAFIADTTAGLRWLDLCAPCAETIVYRDQ
jgi:hypothetical protein